MKDYRQSRDHHIKKKNKSYEYEQQSDLRFKKQKQNKPLNKQYALGLEQKSQVLQKERQQLLRERKANTNNQVYQHSRNNPKDLNYGSHQYIQIDSPSPKFNTKSSSPNLNDKNSTTHPTFQKINELRPLVDKIISQCQNQSSEVKKGLRNLKEAQIRIMKELQVQEYERRRKTESQEYLSQTDKQTKRNISKKMKELRTLIQTIISDCNSNNVQFRESLQNIKNAQKQVLDQIEGQEELLSMESIDQDYKRQSRYKQNYQIGGIESFKESIRINYPSNIQDQIQGLNDIQAKVFHEILTLRQQKLQLMKQINQQIKKTNDITRQYKKLQRDYLRIKSKRQNNSQSSDYNYQEPPLNIKKISSKNDESQNQKLKEKIKRLELSIQKYKQMIGKQKNDNLVNKLRTIIATQDQTIEKLKEQNAMNKSDHKSNKASSRKSNQEIQNLKQQIRNLQLSLKQSQEKNKELQETAQNYFQLQQEFNNLKRQNEQLRVETIRLLKSKGIQAHQSSRQIQSYREEIDKLKNYINKQNQGKLRIIEQISAYKKKFTPYEQQNRILKKKLSELQNQLQASKNIRHINMQGPNQTGNNEQLIIQEKRNKSYSQNYEKPKNYLIKQINDTKKESESGRLQQYRQLLSGLKSIRTQI